MKVLCGVILMCACVAVMGNEEFYGTFRHCFQESGVTREDLAKFFRQKQYAEANYSALKSFFHCSFLAVDVLDEEGNYNSDNLVNNIIRKNPVARSEQIDAFSARAANCADQTAETVDEKAFKITKCIAEATPI